MWEGVSPSHGRDFFGFFDILKPCFGCIIKFKLTSILAPNVYDCSTRGDVSVDTKGGGGGGGGAPTVGTFWKLGY